MLKEKMLVMLSTNQKAVSKGQLVLGPSKHLFKTWDDSEDAKEYVGQHLYILSDEEIKEGDWYLDNYNNSIIKANINSDHKYYVSNCKKIIATTDSSLGLPRPSDGFITKYIKLYNAGTPITKVMVEYEEEPLNDSTGKYATLKVDKDNTITIRSVKESWTREEVIQLIFLAYNLRTTDKEVRSTRKMNEWIQQNL